MIYAEVKGCMPLYLIFKGKYYPRTGFCFIGDVRIS